MEEETSSRWEHVRWDMHAAIDKKNDIKVLECLRAAPHLRLWLHPSTQESALHRAVTKDSFHAYALLQSNKCRFRDEDEKECLQLDIIRRSEIRRQQVFVTTHEEFYIDHIRNAIQPRRGYCHTKLVCMLKKCREDELLATILKVAATSPHLKIIVDDNNEDVQDKAGCETGGLSGITLYDQEQIFVGGKRENLVREASDAEVLGTTLHEVCHFALYLVYNNNGKPYHSTDTEKKRRYEGVLRETQYKLGDLHPVLRSAFAYNKEEELIVRIPHMIGLFITSGDWESKLRDQAPELFEFFKNDVVPDMQKYIRNACPSVDMKNVALHNARLKKAERIDRLKVTFERPLRYQDLQDVPLLIISSCDLPMLEILVQEAVKSTGHPYLFFDSSQWDGNLCQVLREYKANYVLVTCDEAEKFELMVDFLEEVSAVVGTRIILLVQENDKKHYVHKAQSILSEAAGNYCIMDVEEASIRNVTRLCKERVYLHSSIRFQRKDFTMTLCEMVDFNSFVEHVDSSTFLKLCDAGYIDAEPPPPAYNFSLRCGSLWKCVCYWLNNRRGCVFEETAPFCPRVFFCAPSNTVHITLSPFCRLPCSNTSVLSDGTRQRESRPVPV